MSPTSLSDTPRCGYNTPPSLLIFILILMAACFSPVRSIPVFYQHLCLKPSFISRSLYHPNHLLKSRPCPLWSSSFSLCLHTIRKSSSLPPRKRITSVRSFSAPPPPAVSGMAAATTEDNPLLKDFYFPPFDAIDASHVRPGIRALLKQLVCCFCGYACVYECVWVFLTAFDEVVSVNLDVGRGIGEIGEDSGADVAKAGGAIGEDHR